MLLRDVNVRSDEYLVIDPLVERSVSESFIHPAVAEREGVGDGSTEELGRNVGLRLVLLLRLGVLGGRGPELTVGGEV